PSFLDVLTLPVTGTYTVLVDPYSSNTGSATVTLYDVPADVSGTIVPGGSSVSVALNTPGQNARLTFSGTAGQRESANATNNTIAGVTLAVLKPDNTMLGSTFFSSSTGFLDVLTLPTTGTYTLVVDPSSTNTGSGTVTL